MKVKGDSWSGTCPMATICPNLRDTYTGKFLSKKVSYYCSANGKQLDYQYVNSVCKYAKVQGGCWELKYPDCTVYKIYGIRNGR